MDKDSIRISDKLLVYLRTHLHCAMLEYVTPPEQMHGGFETRIYRFQLKGAPQAYSRPLILRLYPEYFGSGNAVWESSIQNVLAEQGFQVAKAHLVCTDMSILGGAFFIMDFISGYPMIDEPIESIPEFLGKTHAAMHNLDTQPLIQALIKAGINENRFHFSTHNDWLFRKVREFPWLHAAGEWLMAHIPPEPDKLVVCHGDFHPLNVMVQGDKVSGVLDWPGFVLADPAFDIAITLVLLTIPYKHLGPALKPALACVDFDRISERYLAAYRTNKDFNADYLSYYRVRRCIFALINGTEGQVSWQQPGIIKDLVDYIRLVTNIDIKVPQH